MQCVDCGSERHPRSPRQTDKPRCKSCASIALWQDATYRKKQIEGIKRGQPLRRRPSRVRKMTDVEAAWVGAMIEGEGGIYCYPQWNHQPMIAVTNTEIETLSTVLRLIGDGGISFNSGTRQGKGVWMWSLSAVNAVADLLPQIIPYLTGKRDRAEKILNMKLGRSQMEVHNERRI